jgi:hypothetical protein
MPLLLNRYFAGHWQGNRLDPARRRLIFDGMIILDRWVENLRCPICGKTGVAQLSVEDAYSWVAQVDSAPEGFKVIQFDYGSNFYCTLCNSPVEP